MRPAAKKSTKRRVRQSALVGAFAERLRDLRRAAGLSQQELARRAHLNLKYVGELERSASAPGLDTLERLATALSVAPSELIRSEPLDPLPFLKQQARERFAAVLEAADRQTLQVLNPILALLEGELSRRRSG